MRAELLRTIVIVAVVCNGALAVADERPRPAPASAASARSADTRGVHRVASRLKRNAMRPPAADRYAEPAASYKADRLSSSRGETILDTPGQTTVLTRQVLDDMNATSLKDALRSSAGVTVGR